MSLLVFSVHVICFFAAFFYLKRQLKFSGRAMYIFSAVSAGYLKSLSLCRNSQAVSFGRFFFFLNPHRRLQDRKWKQSHKAIGRQITTSVHKGQHSMLRQILFAKDLIHNLQLHLAQSPFPISFVPLRAVSCSCRTCPTYKCVPAKSFHLSPYPRT